MTEKIKELLAQKAYIVIAIDGRCGSGKTTLAAKLAREFSARVIHTDDFYLPPEKRHADWEKTAGANMDFKRLYEEVIAPAAQGEDILYRPYVCHGAKKRQEQEGEQNIQEKAHVQSGIFLKRTPLTVVEGSYSHYPEIAASYDLKIFMTCPAKVQEQRLREREKERYVDFEERWIPLEEQYFAEYRILEKCDLCVETGTEEGNK